MKYLSPRSDISFKKLFANEHHKNLTIAFLNNILNLTGTQKITEINLREPVHAPDRAGGKEIIFDVYCTDKQMNHYIIEMQAVNQYNFFERSQYYAARALSTQLKKYDDYIALLPVVFVGVVNYSLDVIKKYKRNEAYRNDAIIKLDQHVQENSDVISKYSFVNQAHNQIIPTPLIELNFVELPKFTKSIEECTTEVDQWLYLMTQADECQEIPEQMKNSSSLTQAFQALEQRSWTREELVQYVEEQEAFGKEDRIKEGALEEGLEKGLQQGLQEGLLQGLEKTAMNMLKKNMSLEEIADITGLSIKAIQILKINKDQ